MADQQADRVIDKLMAERQRALDFAAQQEGQRAADQADETAGVIETKTAKPARRTEIRKIIEEKGEVSPEDLQRLIAKDVRRGI